MKVPVIPLLLLIIITSCTNSEVCDEELRSELVVRFKTWNSEAVVDSVLTGFSIYGIIEGEPGSLINDSPTGSRVVLPLDPGNDHSTFLLEIDEQSDTLRVNHVTGFYLQSYSCGFVSLFTLENLEFTGSLVLDYEIVNSQIDAELEYEEEHLWIYF